MSTPILQTKLYIPVPSQGCILRPRLLDCLDTGLQAGQHLILVSAPAGFGKTTVSANWIEQRDIQATWLSLDKDENEPTRFLAYLIASLQQIDPGIGEDVLSILHSQQQPPLEISLTALLNQIADLSRQTVIVLDDYHVITNQTIHKALAFFVENLPPLTRLVILSRADPPFPLARLRARRQMTEVRAADLRFTLEEAVTFIKQVMKLDLSNDQIFSLESRTEGWIAGLQMAALSLKGKDDPEAFIAAFSGSHRYVLDYLTEEVLGGQSRDVHRFILQTSILDRLTGPLCETLTGQPGGQETLESLENANLFLIPLDDERIWYRYHHLFAGVMANRLQREYSDQIPVLHLRAAKWFQRNNFFAEAIEHALSANDYSFAAEIMASQGVDLLKAGSISPLLGWVNRLPESTLKNHPQLFLSYVWALMLAGMVDNLERNILALEESAKNQGDSENLRGDLSAVRAYAASRRGDFDEAIDQAGKALDWLPRTNLTTRAVMAFVMGGIYYMRREFSKSHEAMRKASQLGEQAGNINVAVSALSASGSFLVDQGNFVEAEKNFHRAMKLGAGRGGRPLPMVSSVFSGLARLHLAERDLLSAREFAQTGLELGEKWLNADSQVGCLLSLAQIEYLEGKPQKAWAALEKARLLAATYQLTPGQEDGIEACEDALFGSPEGGVDQRALPAPLTERELEVLQLLAAGLSNRAIADELVIALGTAKTHISRIMSKLNAENRTRAVVLARQLGLIP